VVTNILFSLTFCGFLSYKYLIAYGIANDLIKFPIIRGESPFSKWDKIQYYPDERIAISGEFADIEQ
jgi:hypothetical protein